MRLLFIPVIVAAALLAACGGPDASANGNGNGATDATRAGKGDPKTSGNGSTTSACSCVYPFAAECETSCELRDVVVRSVNGDQLTAQTIPRPGQQPVTETISIAAAKFNPADIKPGAEIAIAASKSAPQTPKSIVPRAKVPIDPITHKLLPGGR